MSKVDRHGTLDIVSEADWAFLQFDNHLHSLDNGIAGASVNTFLLGAFLYHSRLKSSIEKKDEELPGGSSNWKEICDVLYVTLPSILTISELANRVLMLVDDLVSDEAAYLQQRLEPATTITSSGSVGAAEAFVSGSLVRALLLSLIHI